MVVPPASFTDEAAGAEMFTAGVSSSSTVTTTLPLAASAPAARRVWLTVTVSSAASSSCRPVTVAVCAVFQVLAVKVRVAGATVAAASSPLLGVMVTSPVGAESSIIV